MILDLDLTLKDEDLKPFWNEVCEEFHKQLWLPHEIVSPEQVSHSSKRLSNYQVDQSKYLMTKMTKKKTSTSKNLLVSSQAISTLITEKDLQNEEKKLVVTHKIRFFPKYESRYLKALHTYRLAYNLTVEALNNNEEISSELRRKICNTIKDKYSIEGNLSDYVYDVNLIQEAYRKCVSAFVSQCRKFKNTNKPFKSAGDFINQLAKDSDDYAKQASQSINEKLAKVGTSAAEAFTFGIS